MARRKRPRTVDWSLLQSEPPGNLRLPSLAYNRLEGHAYRYTVMLPLLSETGDVVFSLEDHVAPLMWLLDTRFGGCTATAATP